MHILFTTSEAAPFAQTGGLADVCSSLPIALSQLGHDVTVVLPAYRSVFHAGLPIQTLGKEIAIPFGHRIVKGNLLESAFPGSTVRVILLQQDHYYDRSGIYNFYGHDFADNCERFVFLSRGVFEIIEALELDVDIIHANDWQTGLVPAYQKLNYGKRPRYNRIKTVLTIHNLAYQGVFWHIDMPLTGLGWEYFNYEQLEFYGNINFLKAGIVFADQISTVSPRYAAEIRTPEYGCNLDSALRLRENHLRGILNGIDTNRWNPANDPNLIVPYSVEDVFEKKPACKAELQRIMGLEQRADIPIFGLVGRLAYQKGIDYVLESIPDWVENHNVQYCILGTGDQSMEQRFREMQERFPNNVAVRLEFSDSLAHQIEAGSDMFLMPSRYEPCGLNQMYSLRYGTVPIVRETGGLADTVVDANEETIANGTANGFRFAGTWLHDFNETVWRALECYLERPDDWKQIVQNGMRGDWGWEKSAKQYCALYEELLEGRG